MPEGHTIHRIARDHGKLLNGTRLRVSSPQGRFAADAARVDGEVLDGIEAYGKHLFYWWANGEVGHVHLGLFGKFRVHVIHAADADHELETFGQVRMRLANTSTVIDLAGPTACSVGPADERDAIVARLGPDPLRNDADPGRMFAKIAKSKRGIGDLVMDQAVVAGVGNVYRAEALFVLGMHPERPGNTLADAELHALWATVQAMLEAGVKANRIVTVSREEIGWPRGKRIPRREATYVYKRDRCVRCGDAIRTLQIAGRTCYYCPTDQPS